MQIQGTTSSNTIHRPKPARAEKMAVETFSHSDSFQASAEPVNPLTVGRCLDFVVNEGLPVVLLVGIGLSAGTGVAGVLSGVLMGSAISFCCQQ